MNNWSAATASDDANEDTSCIPGWYRRAIAHVSASAFIEIQSARIHYLSWGDDSSGKPVLLFIHGFRAHAHWWDFIAPFFAEHYRVIAMDLGGMGDSGHRSQYSVEIFAAEICGLIEALGCAPVIAVGHSYGGARLLRACAEQRDLFSHLIIVDSFVRFRGESGPPPLRLVGRVHPDFEQACARYRLMPEQPGALPFLVDHVARRSLRPVDGGWRWKFDPDMVTNGSQEIDAEILLPRIGKPVDFVYGEHSKVVSRLRAERIAAYLPLARSPVMIPGAHHHLMLDQPLALISTLRALLSVPSPQGQSYGT